MYLNNYLVTILNFETKIIDEDMYSGLQGYFESNEDSIKHAGYKAASSGIALSLIHI